MIARLSSAMLRVLLVVLALVGLAGCFTNESTELVEKSNGQTPVSPGNPNNPNDPDDSLPPVPVNPTEIRLFVEATPGMNAATTAQRLWQLLTPTPAYALEAGNRLSTATLSVRQLDYQGNLVSGGVDPRSYTVFLNSDNSYTLRFDSGIPDRLDLVIVAQLTNGTLLRHGLPNRNKSIRVNAASEYVVRELFSRFESASQLQSLSQCASGDTACTAQKTLRMTNWELLLENVQTFELDLPEIGDLASVLEFLDQQLLFRDYVDQFAETVLEDKLQVVDGSSITPVMDARDGSYNALYFALGLNQGRPSDDEQSVVFSRRANAVKESRSGTVVSYTYPNFVFSPTILGFSNSLLVESLTFTRRANALIGPADYLAEALPTQADVNQFVGTTISFMNSQGYLDLGRLQVQAITRENEASPRGWLTNPHYTRLYSMRNAGNALSSDSMASAFWSTGQLFELTKDGSRFERVRVEEDLNTFGWIFHSRISPDSAPFSIDQLDGADYVTLSLEQRPGEDPLLAWQSAIAYWDINDGTVTSLQPLAGEAPNTGGEDLFRTFTLERTLSDATDTLLVSRQDNAQEFAATALPSLRYNQQTSNYDEKFTGRLQVGEWVGMSDPDGNVLSFNTANGSGIAHAIRVQTTGAPNLAGARFVLYGNSISTTDDETAYHNHNRSTLVFDDDSATLTLTQNTVVANHDDRSVTVPRDDSALLTPVSTSTAQSLGSIRNLLTLEFDDPAGNGEPLVLDGAIASGGNLLVLRVRQDQRVGLLYGFRELELTEESN